MKLVKSQHSIILQSTCTVCIVYHFVMFSFYWSAKNYGTKNKQHRNETMRLRWLIFCHYFLMFVWCRPFLSDIDLPKCECMTKFSHIIQISLTAYGKINSFFFLWTIIVLVFNNEKLHFHLDEYFLGCLMFEVAIVLFYTHESTAKVTIQKIKWNNKTDINGINQRSARSWVFNCGAHRINE